jgi:hypothetical protein
VHCLERRPRPRPCFEHDPQGRLAGGGVEEGTKNPESGPEPFGSCCPSDPHPLQINGLPARRPINFPLGELSRTPCNAGCPTEGSGWMEPPRRERTVWGGGGVAAAQVRITYWRRMPGPDLRREVPPRGARCSVAGGEGGSDPNHDFLTSVSIEGSNGGKRERISHNDPTMFRSERGSH